MSKRASSKLTAKDHFKIVAISTAILLAIYGVIFGVGFLCLSVLSMVLAPLAPACGNDVLDEVYSPDSQYKVVVFLRSCGAFDGSRTHASILKADEDLSDANGVNIFYAYETVKIQVSWINSHSVQITYAPPIEFSITERELEYSDQVFEIYYRARQNE